MALKGTLKDFGIADILQLIGQQQKEGVLHLKTKDQSVAVSFHAGNIVKAETSTRSKKDLIGTMLVQAELLTEQQLDAALETQKRTLKRLGDVLVSQRLLDEARFRQMVQLQTSETLYKLFAWKSGSYEFELTEVDVDPLITPLRAESVLMEGFRMVDEWPVVMQKITSYEMTFTRIKELPPAASKATYEGEAVEDEKSRVSEMDRKVYMVVGPERTVRKVIDMSCLGEFEACKSLSNLVTLGYLQANEARGAKTHLGGPSTGSGDRWSGVLGRLVVTLFVFLALLFIGTQIDFTAIRLGQASATTYTDPAAQRFISRQQVSRIEAALDLYRLEKGEVPPALDALVSAGLLQSDDLRYPWRDTYYYRRTDKNAWVLLPPLR